MVFLGLRLLQQRIDLLNNLCRQPGILRLKVVPLLIILSGHDEFEVARDPALLLARHDGPDGKAGRGAVRVVECPGIRGTRGSAICCQLLEHEQGESSCENSHDVQPVAVDGEDALMPAQKAWHLSVDRVGLPRITHEVSK